MKKKLTSLFLALVLCLGLTPMTVHADVHALSPGQKFDFSYSSEGHALSEDFWIAESGWYSFTPSPLSKSIEVLSTDAFYVELKADSGNYVLDVDCSEIQSVVAEYHGETGPGDREDVWYIEDGVLRGCDTIHSRIEIPDTVTEIGGDAMINDTCLYLTEVIIPNSVTKLDDFAFYGCYLTSVIIPTSVVEIGENAFSIGSYDEDSDELYYVPNPELTVYGEAGSYAQAYCQKNNISFEIIGGSTQPSQPTPPADTIPASGTAKASTQTVTVDGKAVEFQMYALVDENGNGTNYIKLRDMAQVLNGTKAQFSVGYDNASKSISVATGEAYTSTGSEMTTPFSGDRAYTGGSQSIQVDGEATEMTAITLLDDAGGGYNYFKLRDLGKALGFNVGWSKEAGVFIESDKPYAE